MLYIASIPPNQIFCLFNLILSPTVFIIAFIENWSSTNPKVELIITTKHRLPNYIDRPSAWIGCDLKADAGQWLQKLSNAEIADLESAAAHFLSLGKNIGEISRGDFPLKRFGQHLETLKTKLINGIGVELIRGLPIEAYSRELCATIFCGIGTYLGTARSQNAQGHILGHVRDIGLDPQNTSTRIYQTSARQTFHTDSTDVVGLMCLHAAKNGGESLLVSAETLFNRMQQQRPDLVPHLFEVVATDRRGEVPPGEKPFFEIPVLSWYEELLTVQYQRQYIDSAQRFARAPKLKEKQIQALDYFDALANDSELHLSMELQPGDMQFVYNHSQLHDRTRFDDWDEPQNRRHLFRLWLSIAGDRPLPPCFESRYGSLEIGNRGGIVTKHTHLQAPLD